MKNTIIYVNKSTKAQLLGFYYFVSQKSYSESEDTWRAYFNHYTSLKHNQ